MSGSIAKLQEYTQKAKIELPTYEFIELLSEHPKKYICNCYISSNTESFTATDTSKQKAKNKAAELALAALPSLDSITPKTEQKIKLSKDPKQSVEKIKILHNWHGAVLDYATQTKQNYELEITLIGQINKAIAMFDGKTYSAVATSKQTARLLVAKQVFEDIGLTYVDRLDVSQIIQTLKTLLPNESNYKVIGDRVDIVTKTDLSEQEKQKILELVTNKHIGTTLEFYVNVRLDFPASDKPNAKKDIKDGIEQNNAAVQIP